MTFKRWRSGYSGVLGMRPPATGSGCVVVHRPGCGVDGVWDNALAAEPPIYNDDFTQMTVKLREGLYWSDGVEFSGDDLYFTVDLLRTHLEWGNQGLFENNVDHMEQPDRNTVVSTSKNPTRASTLPSPCAGAPLHHAQAHLGTSRGPGSVHIQSSGQPGRLHAQRFRSERQMVLVGAPRRLAAEPRSPALAEVSVKYAMYI